MSRTPHLVIHEADVDECWQHPGMTHPAPEVTVPLPVPSARPHYVTKVSGNGETVWTSQILHDRSGATRFARRESAAHTVPLPIVKAWLP